MATIAVGSINKTETMDLNGGMTARNALAKFFRVRETDVEEQLNAQVVRLNSQTLEANELTTPLRGGDFLSVYPQDVARGIKGAYIS